ncbi:MAG TPA: NAD(P)H-dependent oxidoreductase subunit E, partial [Candidatus Polarisedimenticolia bacterium]|nr:NAD(P)H-dependent oxidoreductase subunit E [Candidatus Polarisedimenticolia bacterium]
MDLRIGSAEPSASERKAIDAVLGPPASGWDGGERRVDRDGRSALGGHEARDRRHMLLPALHAAQAREGWISPGALNYICRRLTLPPADVWGVATFYAMLSVQPRPGAVAHVCDDIACRMKGAEDLCRSLAGKLGPEARPPEGASATWLRSPCLGLCEQAPGVLVTRAGARPVEQAIGSASAGIVLAQLRSGRARGRKPAAAKPGNDARPKIPQMGQAGLRLLRRIGLVDPESLDDYRAHGGYDALRRAAARGAAGVIREVPESQLLGRGGAAFPTGRKWDAVARSPVRPRYLVCNADESEPGTFKDR